MLWLQIFYHGILQRNYRKMTIKEVHEIMVQSLYNTLQYNMDLDIQ